MPARESADGAGPFAPQPSAAKPPSAAALPATVQVPGSAELVFEEPVAAPSLNPEEPLTRASIGLFGAGSLVVGVGVVVPGVVVVPGMVVVVPGVVVLVVTSTRVISAIAAGAAGSMAATASKVVTA